MPKIEKTKTKKLKKAINLTTKNKAVKKNNLPTKTKKIKHSPVDYYNCLLTKAQQD
jgi:hypothetical protein